MTRFKQKGAHSEFSGVGDQQKNAQDERAIQTVVYIARTLMLHASLHWSELGFDCLYLWYFAVKNYVWIYNQWPRKESGLTPL